MCPRHSEYLTAVIHALIAREGTYANHKRIYRLYSEADLTVKRRKKRRGIEVTLEPLLVFSKANKPLSKVQDGGV